MSGKQNNETLTLSVNMQCLTCGNFTRLSVILFIGEWGGGGFPASKGQEDVCIPACNGQGVYSPLGRHPPPPETVTESAGTHPTGMYSCLHEQVHVHPLVTLF